MEAHREARVTGSAALTLIRRVPHDRVDDLKLVDSFLQANLSNSTVKPKALRLHDAKLSCTPA
jgi:hypothetical protein